MQRFDASAIAALMIAAWAGTAAAAQTLPELAQRLTPAQLRLYEAYRAQQEQFETSLAGYWRSVETKRGVRRAKRMLAQRFTGEDYVSEQPPKYTGPNLPPEIAKVLEELNPAPQPRPLASLSDFLASAKAHYGFVPTTTSEQDFKRRYAQEALHVGLTKEQVVRVYALETGGQGTYDMQAGINPLTKQGRPISSALGYAQLLNGNSIDELVKHGERFIKRLLTMSAAEGSSSARAAALREKAGILRRMLVVARSVPNAWASHVRLAGTSKGLGIHTLNLDADVGPWLQVLKLHGLQEDAARAGRAQLSGAEIELMNLAGPGTGLEMMLPVARAMPTSNFFSRVGYYRNGIVREKTAGELLEAIAQRMEANLKKPGAIEFARIFDEVARR